MYKISIRKRAIKALENIPDPFYTKIRQEILLLAVNPRPLGYIKLKGREAYRIRVADYRIIYQILDEIMIVDVIDLGHRKSIYE